MNISILAPKGGVGSSTLAVLLANVRSLYRPMILVDAAPDPSLDIYTATDHLMPESAENLTEQAVAWAENCRRIRLEAEEIQAQLPPFLGIEHQDLIIDWGVPTEDAIHFLAGNPMEVIVVLTQDNQVLRSADRLLGRLRQAGIRCRFVISHLQEADAADLADLDEVFDLVEEDYLGAIPWNPALRIQMNRGNLAELDQSVQTNLEQINERIEEQAADSDEDVDTTIEEENPELPEGTAAPVETEQAGSGVLSNIRRFFKNFGKGR
ncbi:hypothetical protein NQU17_06370 [Clostridiaceae bacterium HFYG-1003]|nr:hypothetical protein NQU17_06370 [Clostridiaceae bacterium HFYG-1003]